MIVAEVAPGYEPVVDLARKMFDRDPRWRFQLCVLDDRGVALSLSAGAGYAPDAIHLQASTTKGVSGVAIGLLVERGLLDPEAPVVSIWPEFGVRGKQTVTVAQLLSHQAGLIGFSEPLPIADIGRGRAAAADLASQRPTWAPGAAHGYHSLTIGVLADEIVFRLVGMQLWEFYEREIATPFGIDYWIRLPESERHRVVPVELSDPGDPQAWRGSLADTANEALVSLGENNGWINSPDLLHAGIPSVSGTGSARGLASAYAVAIGAGDLPRLLGEDTLAQISQLRTAGHDLVLGSHTRFGMLFEKPHDALDFGTASAFGHDGAGGALGFADPGTGVAFGYTCGRVPVPGGADARALLLAQRVREVRAGG